ncbi:sugar phosphate isomerase/epimerase family protein [Priestia endophytica]|uniref:sugar phosphate isomerase/epimerase family protein n=1 Tax=Priestia endophytica TaxID=135735 RepID=UPI0018CD2986|nr:sugar phosphate isomerase/epimerase family protein [Priestia endophytica]
MKLACSTWMMPGNTFFEKMRKAAEYGFDGVEIRLFENELSPQKIKEILKALADNGLSPSSLLVSGETFRRPLIDNATRDAKIEHAKKTLDAAAQLGCPALVCPEYGAQVPLPLFDHPVRPTKEQHELLIEYLTFVADYAIKNNVFALIEPINRYETRFFYSLQDGKNIIDEVGKSNLYLLADFFHMNLEEVSIPDAFRMYGKDIMHVHLGDSNRLLPGQGHTDFNSGLAALRDIGYEGYMALECSISGEPDIVFPQCIRFLRDAMRDR